ncbi:MAG: hypothetical protein EXS05_13535 [Planctomycetaceae bacterium]|nr:hypothetical protein [Planctomycetaceae bacterium]
MKHGIGISASSACSCSISVIRSIREIRGSPFGCGRRPRRVLGALWFNRSMPPVDDGSLSKSRVFSSLVAQHGSSSCRFLSASSRKIGLSSPKMHQFHITLRDFGDNGQFNVLFDGSPEIAASFNASHNGKRVYDPKSLQNTMLKYKG